MKRARLEHLQLRFGQRTNDAGRASDEEVAAAAANVVALSQSLIQLWRIGRDEAELARMSEQVALAASGVLAA